MALFSQRKGIRPLEKTLQRESIDDELRNRLWSALSETFWSRWSRTPEYRYPEPAALQVEEVLKLVWINHFKHPLDTLPPLHRTSNSGYDEIREYFFKAEWWQVYDFIEFILESVPKQWLLHIKTYVNMVLEGENAAYRLVDGEIVEITDSHEIGSIESALSQGVASVTSHLQRALDMLSDRKNPDYRNSIKEAISAVEACCQTISGKPKAMLGDCLRALKDKQPMHSAFEQALVKLYGYTSDEGGIRHALTEVSATPSYGDAKFMLVSCSAFINYLWTKSAELGLKVNK